MDSPPPASTKKPKIRLVNNVKRVDSAVFVQENPGPTQKRRKSSGLRIKGPRKVETGEEKKPIDLTVDASGTEGASEDTKTLLQQIGKTPGSREPVDDEYDLPDGEYELAYSRLRELGVHEYLKESVNLVGMTLRKIASIFGEDPKKDQTVDAYLSTLERVLGRECNERMRLPRPSTLEEVAMLLKTQRSILVITGAGISTSAGIPDFRSKDTGFFAKLQELGYDDPMDLLDIDNFNDDPSNFYAVASDLLAARDKPHTPTHQFIKLLQDQGRLLTNYTQNIDNLEASAGIMPKRMVQCHGSFATAQCLKCHQMVQGNVIYADIAAKRVPRCKACIQRLREKEAAKKGTRTSSRKRSANDAEDAYKGVGVMKPGIIMYGEHVGNYFERCLSRDLPHVDMVLVIGTSLSVAPVSRICQQVKPNVPQVYIGRERNTEFGFDCQLLGECDQTIAALCNRAGWMLSHAALPVAFEAETEMVRNAPGVWRVREKTLIGGQELLEE